MMTDDSFELYIVYSTKDLKDIVESLYSFSERLDQIGSIRKDPSRDAKGDYKKSNRNITLIKTSLYEILKNEGFCNKTEYDFMISKYEIRSGNYPPNDSNNNLYFPASKDGKEVQIIKTKMGYFVQMKLISSEDYKINESGIIIFNENVDILTRIKIKIMLDDYDDGFRVSWCKKRFFNLHTQSQS